MELQEERAMPYVNTTALRVCYEQHGSGCPVLLIGGVGGDLRDEPGVLERKLADRFELLSFDQRGTGQTDKPDSPYTMTDYARDAASLMDAVGWNSAHVVGVSFGGMVAQELALQFPRYVRSLVLACTASGGAGGSSYPLHELSDLSPAERARKMLAIADVRRNEAWQATHPEETEQLLKQAAAAASEDVTMDRPLRTWSKTFIVTFQVRK
jgi:3-oxoadipate enol-lactonase